MNISYELSPFVSRKLEKWREHCVRREGQVDLVREAFKVSKLILKEAEIARDHGMCTFKQSHIKNMAEFGLETSNV